MQELKKILKDYELSSARGRINIFDVLAVWHSIEKQKYEKRNNQKATAPKTSK